MKNHGIVLNGKMGLHISTNTFLQIYLTTNKFPEQKDK